MKSNLWLALTAAVLLALSLLSFNRDIHQGQRFERGQKFLPQLNPDEIHAIEIQQNGETINLKLDDNKFLLANFNDYPAKTETVNRFLKDVLELGLEKEVGKGTDLEKELELQADSKEALVVILKNKSDSPMVHFVLGKTAPDGRGRFIERLDGKNRTIYLTSQTPYFTTTADGYLDKDLLELKEAQIGKIKGSDFEFERQDGVLKLKTLPAGKVEKSSEVAEIKGIFTGLRFEKAHLADATEVAGLTFKQVLAAELDDHSGYRLQFAQHDSKSFLKIEAYIDVEQIQLSQDESKEELKEKAKILTRSNEVQSFNQFHGSWVYELNETTAKKCLKTKAELIEASPKN